MNEGSITLASSRNNLLTSLTGVLGAYSMKNKKLITNGS